MPLTLKSESEGVNFGIYYANAMNDSNGCPTLDWFFLPVFYSIKDKETNAFPICLILFTYVACYPIWYANHILTYKTQNITPPLFFPCLSNSFQCPSMKTSYTFFYYIPYLDCTSKDKSNCKEIRLFGVCRSLAVPFL